MFIKLLAASKNVYLLFNLTLINHVDIPSFVFLEVFFIWFVNVKVSK